jgi:DNA-binding response OmpR family regulator
MGLPQQGQKKILVVDDEPDLTMLCRLALEYHGFKVDSFTIHKKHYQTISQDTMI